MSKNSNPKNSNPFMRSFMNLRVVQTKNPVYAVSSEDVNGYFVHIGDAESQEAVRAVAQRLGFQTGAYRRCWEVSDRHLTEASGDYLIEETNPDTSDSHMFAAFRIPYSPAIGVSLISTPWTDANLQRTESITVKQLLQTHRDRKVPEDLAHILYLAAEADVHILVFDREAPILPGLPLYG